MADKIRIEGLKGVLDTLTVLPAEIVSKNGGPVGKVLRNAAKLIQIKAQQNIRAIVTTPNKDQVPSQSSGALEAAVQVKRRVLPAGQKGERYWVGVVRLKGKKLDATKSRKNIPTSFYAQHLESGTERAAAHPFWTPAVESRKMVVLKYIERELPKEVNNILRKLKQKYRVRI